MDPAFAEWSKDLVLFCHVTTGNDADPHQDLLEKKGGQGFPHLVFMDSDGEVLLVHEGPRTVDGFKEGAQKVQGMRDLRRKAEGGDKPAKLEWAVCRAEGGRMDLEAFEKELAAAGPLTKEQEAQAAPLKVTLEVRGILATVTRERQTQIAAGKRFLEMKKAGRIPQDDQAAQPYWILMMGVADDLKDAALFSEGLEALKARFGGKPGTDAFFQQAEKRLSEIQGAKP